MPKGRISISKERCKGCELCIVVCPRQILSMSDDVNDRGVRFAECVEPSRCTGCAACALVCPEPAIEVWKQQ